METQNEIKLSIPKPCHEDWNKMKPNEKGAFCGKCAKTVIDFTNKTTAQIKEFFAEQTGNKICGRFIPEQLDEPAKQAELFIPLHLLPRKLSPVRAFALFIVFGTTLFSCSTQQGEVVGKISALDTARLKKGEVVEKRLMGDTISSEETQPKNSEVNSKSNCVPEKGDVEIMMLGDVAFTADTVKHEPDSIKQTRKGKIRFDNQ
ncbi:MAG TPA: hypothetical protein VF868_14095 [Bacteroidia bacterium]|jgi:hypothetical protein